MYSQPGRPGPGRGGRGRYMKGRLPQGVDFAAYPGRSSTPLPTAESKSAERINQLKIWNEAATNDDKRRLHTAKSKQALSNSGSANRRTDSFKDARDRHSASFQADAPKEKPAPPAEEKDIFADRSDSDSEENITEKESAPAVPRVKEDVVDEDTIEVNEDVIAPAKPADIAPATRPSQTKPPIESVAPSTSLNQNSERYHAPPAQLQTAPPPAAVTSPSPVAAHKPRLDTGGVEGAERQQPPKERKGCCTIQ